MSWKDSWVSIVALLARREKSQAVQQQPTASDWNTAADPAGENEQGPGSSLQEALSSHSYIKMVSQWRRSRYGCVYQKRLYIYNYK